jgi:hypothetical protein
MWSSQISMSEMSSKIWTTTLTARRMWLCTWRGPLKFTWAATSNLRVRTWTTTCSMDRKRATKLKTRMRTRLRSQKSRQLRLAWNKPN